MGLYGVWVEYLQGLGEVNCPDQSIDLFVPDIMAEYDEGGVDARHEGQGGDEVPEVCHSVMNLDNYYHGMIGYWAVETVMNGLKLKRFQSLL